MGDPKFPFYGRQFQGLAMWFCGIDWTSIATVALVVVTGYYAWSTHRILSESQKTRKAVERQALAIEESNRLLSQQMEEAMGLGREIVRTSIQTAMRNVTYWKSLSVPKLVDQNALPSKIELVPPDAQAAVYHARRINPEASFELSNAFDNLRIAQTELEVMKGSKVRGPGFVEAHTKNALYYIEIADTELCSALQHLEMALDEYIARQRMDL